MKKDLILAGVGGQGILSIASVIGRAALSQHLHVKQSEVHGMSQRGGEVQAHLRLSTAPVDSDLIPEGKADIIVGMEPLETLRYLPYLKNDGWLVTNSKPYVNIDQYPDLDLIYDKIREFPNHLLLDTEEMARKCGSAKASNMVLLGALSGLLELKKGTLEKAIEHLFHKKGERVVAINLDAFAQGQNALAASEAHISPL
ncbi:MAG: indolepyruvate oxidoreductase subunit beta [Cyclobacteriaceae bacterium]|nr:indolepyruvate oxidoreductase subunit beta [Cyclobacteriaceae bacterium]